MDTVGKILIFFAEGLCIIFEIYRMSEHYDQGREAAIAENMRLKLFI